MLEQPAIGIDRTADDALELQVEYLVCGIEHDSAPHDLRVALPHRARPKVRHLPRHARRITAIRADDDPRTSPLNLGCHLGMKLRDVVQAREIENVYFDDSVSAQTRK